MSKFEEMMMRLSTLTAAMQACIDSDDLDGADAKKNEIVALRKKMDEQAFLDSFKMPEPVSLPAMTVEDGEAANRTKENASFIRACIKKFSGRSLTEAENALLLPTGTGSAPDGEHGEGYTLPEDIRTKIQKRLREFKSLRIVCGQLITTALSGAYPIENLDSLTGLVDFTDGTDGADATDFSFSQVTFSLKEKAGFIKLSNTLLALSDNDLIGYIVEIFAKKAIITENAMAVAAITSGKTAKVLTGWQDLKSSINVDLDPAALNGTVIVTNQDGFDYLDKQLDQTGKPLLQPDLTDKTRKMFCGYPIEVFSNSAIASTAATSTKDGYAPIYYGDLKNGVKFVDLNIMKFATSPHAGFMSNTTIARLIEFVDVIQHDSSDKCYCVGKLKIVDKTGS